MKDSLHNGTTVEYLGLLAAAAWLGKRLLGQAMDRVGSRIADWLLPLGLPTTYRPAQLALALTRILAPGTRTSLELSRHFRLGTRRPLLPGFDPQLRRQRLSWEDLDAAEAELEVDRQQKIPIANPLRFVAPLLLRALRIRLANCSARVRFLTGVLLRPFFILVLLLLRFLGWVLWLPFGFVGVIYRKCAASAAQALLRSAIRRFPEEMEEEERDYWIKVMGWDVHARRRRIILTPRFAMNVWIRGRLCLPDRSRLPSKNWGAQKWTEQATTELLSAGDDVQFHARPTGFVEERPAGYSTLGTYRGRPR